MATAAAEAVIASATFEAIYPLPAAQRVGVDAASRKNGCGEDRVDSPGRAVREVDLLDIVMAAGKPVFDSELIIAIDQEEKVKTNAMQRKIRWVDATTKNNPIHAAIAKVVDHIFAIADLVQIGITKPGIALQLVIAAAARKAAPTADAVVASSAAQRVQPGVIADQVVAVAAFNQVIAAATV